MQDIVTAVDADNRITERATAGADAEIRNFAFAASPLVWCFTYTTPLHLRRPAKSLRKSGEEWKSAAA